MKYLIIGVLVFTASCCFAIDKKLVDGARKYDAAVANLNKVISDITAADIPIGEWIKEFNKAKDNNLSVSDRRNAQNKIDEADKRRYDLNIQYAAAEEVVKKYEPIKNEYDKQVEIEVRRERFWTTILSIISVLSIFVTVFWWVLSQYGKYKKLLKEGKITQKEYDRMMQCHKSSMFRDDTRTNPATGLTMIGGCDSGGNPAGCSFKSGSTFDSSQDYRDRHLWD